MLEDKSGLLSLSWLDEDEDWNRTLMLKTNAEGTGRGTDEMRPRVRPRVAARLTADILVSMLRDVDGVEVDVLS